MSEPTPRPAEVIQNLLSIDYRLAQAQTSLSSAGDDGSAAAVRAIRGILVRIRNGPTDPGIVSALEDVASRMR
jgi:hypothetical protein